MAIAALAILAMLVSTERQTRAQTKPPRGFRTHDDPKLNLRLKIPKFLHPIPVKDSDKQTLAKFAGSYPIETSRGKTQRTLTLFVVRIETSEGPITGQGGSSSARPSPAESGPTPTGDGEDSLTQQRENRLNSGRTLKEYGNLRRLGTLVKQPIRAYGTQPKQELERFRPSNVIALVTETDGEVVGIVAQGPVHQNIDGIRRAAKTLEIGGSRKFIKPEADPYEDSQLRDIPRRRKVRSNLISGWSAHDTENFILVSNVKKSATLKRMLVDLEVMRAAYTERFPPEDPKDLEVVSTVRVCDGYDDYLRYAGAGLRGTGGYWAFLDEELVLFNPERRIPKASRWLKDVDAIAVLYHEAMHQYLFYANGKIAPASWFGEGYGEVFGGAVVNRFKFSIRRLEKNDGRLKLVRLVRKTGDLPALRPLLKATQTEFYAPKRALQNYAFGWAFCYFLELESQAPLRNRSKQSVEGKWAEIPRDYLKNLRAAKHKLMKARPKFIKTAAEQDRYLYKNFAPIQDRAFRLTFQDRDLDALEEAWHRFIKKL